MSTATSAPSLARRERTALADLLLTLGPDQPTCCGDWTTRDLAAHLVIRERRPDAGPGIMVPPLAGYTERVRRRAAGRPYDELVRTLRRPPWLLPGPVDALINTTEFFIHHEDVRRAQPDWQPRELAPADQRALWRPAAGIARLRLRRLGFPVTVAAAYPDERPGGEATADAATGGEVTVGGDGQPARLTGQPGELLLFLSGRQRLARVETAGSESQVAALREAPLGL